MDRCVVLDRNGNICADGAPADVLNEHGESLAGQGIWVPGIPAPEPIAVDPALVTPVAEVPGQGALVTAHDVEVRYRSAFVGQRREAGTVAVSALSCELQGGRALMLRGPSGAGKTTRKSVV